MKHFLIAIVLLSFLYSCSDRAGSAEKKISASSQSTASPIEGNWILVSNIENGKLVIPKRSPQQIKMFQDGYFSFVMYDAAGSFYLAGAGPYELDGNMYKETFQFCSDTIYNGASDWQQWELKGDTLYFYGFKKVELANGKDITDVIGRDKLVEKRVRLKG
ncbi:MAG TPA: hypothetical protein VJU78_08050 [Chitinophagaceae bacterium]|nr:hypothetical protein [Chitinophagaceae bacterium]